jgi:uncharacterized protein (TIGR03067 family)
MPDTPARIRREFQRTFLGVTAMRCMMAMAVVTALSLLGASVGSAAGDKKGIEGTWKLTSAKFGGKEEAVPEGKGVTLKFMAGGKMTADEGGGKTDVGTYKVDDTKKPKTLDLTMKKDGKQDTVLAIYEVAGDTLKIGFPDDPKAGGGAPPRPASFDGATGVLTFKRAAK